MEIVIAAAARTAMGAFQGALQGVSAPRLGAAVLGQLAGRLNMAENEADLVLMGNVLSAGIGQAPARQATVFGGLGQSVPAVTLNKMCGSGLEAIIQGERAIRTGDARVVFAGGMESMSNAPYLLPGARGGLRLGNAQAVDSLISDGLWDAYGDKHMGSCAELCADRYSFTREEQDTFAARSYRRAQEAQASGAFADEIVTVTAPARRGEGTPVTEDEGPAQVDFDRLPRLRAAFETDGTITAGNASTINDGAAAVVLTSAAHANERGWTPLAVIRGSAVHAHEPEWFTTAPVTAMQRLLEKVSWGASEVDAWEINEAFSVVPMAAIRELGLDEERVNVLGGAVALGHPIGASGARIVVTLLNALRRGGGKKGVAGICIGGGEALALALELAD